MLGFIRVYVNGDLVASKWSLSSSRFCYFNIGPVLYSANFKTLSDDDDLCLCTLRKEEVEIQHQKLALAARPGATDGLLLPVLTVCFVFVSALFVTGCLYWDVANEFYYALYGTTLLLVAIEIIGTLRNNALVVVDADVAPGSSTGEAAELQNLCKACNASNPKETPYCRRCGCPLNASDDLVKGWIRSVSDPPLKPSRLNHLQDRISPSRVFRVPFAPAQLVSKCPECRLFMYAYDASCPHCEYRLKLSERQELCEMYNYDREVVANILLAFFVSFLVVVFLIIYAAQNL